MSNTETQPTRCTRCRRVLHSAASIKAAAGRWCRARIRAAQLADLLKGFTDRQIDAARELIADGGLVALGHPGAYRVVSSDGSAVYTTTAKGCNCPNWLRRLSPNLCKHNLAVMILNASGKAA